MTDHPEPNPTPPQPRVRRFTLSKVDFQRTVRRIRHPEGYVPGIDPIRDAILLKKVNAWWAKLGAKYGFKWETVRPAIGYGPDTIVAEPLDPEAPNEGQN